MSEPVTNWASIINKNVRSKDFQPVGYVASIADSGLTIMKDSGSKYRIPKSYVEGFDGSEVSLNVLSKDLPTIAEPAVVTNRTLTAIFSLGSFLAVSYLFFLLLKQIGASSEVSAVLSLVAGSFGAYIVMSASGIIKEFSIKSGLFEFTSKLEDKIQNVQTDVVESKRDLEDKINALNQNLNQSIQSMSSKIDTKITSSANQNQFTNIDIGSLFREFSDKIEKGKIERIKDARIGNKLESSKVSLPAGVKEDIEKYDDLQQKLWEIQQLLERLSPIDIEQALKEANYYYYAGKYEKALRRYDDILKQDPNKIDALVNKGMVHYRLSQYEKARVCFSQALNLQRDNFDASIYKAMLFYKTGKIEEAKRYYKKAISLKIDENNIDALVNKGIAYEHLGDQSEAKSYFQKVIESEIDPQSGDGLVNKGIAFDKLGKYEDARDYYTRALKIDKENVFAQYSYARSYALEGKIDNCLDILEEIVEKHPQYKKTVKDDPDFKNIKSSERFRKLIGTILP